MNIVKETFSDISRSSKFNSLTDEEVAYEYQVDVENRDRAVATIFLRHRSMMGFEFGGGNRYWYSEDDRMSLFLESIFTSLRDYDPKRKAAYKTILFRYFKNRLRQEDQYIFTNRRRWFVEALLVDPCPSASEDDVVGITLDFMSGGEEDEYSELLMSLESCDLSDNQMRYCEYIICQNRIPKNSEAARDLGISESGISVIKQYLRKKLVENQVLENPVRSI